MVKINGENRNDEGKTVSEILFSARYDPQRVAVECNGEIIPKSQYGNTVLQEGDCVEIVRFVGGG